ncbi:ycfV [Wigglesworthia glossinidia endosymbiont of Glossina brevipalpis]|uniref:Lipoprotein-releasing system ATP-binding protein LolD n=1 Tax=Wigglesworthia glossinidia brevipalpis TaxID=36870 RepID=LOLD_WIGBR|nr:RecName: Full=Lipoprotein-releasing system ATP-binding protein LolD [Wigglesworthia glossinidia endosymbiont of Glossina brevipalpis]BAC24247.1 ycfV [Wigglesworthia glossinidia endosymbiont of Glossina brevipalpis]
MNNMVLLKCKNVTKTYKTNKKKIIILNNINLSIYNSETISIIGDSGSGKSTLLYLLSGLDNPTTGKITFKGKEINKLSSSDRSYLRNKNFGFIYQFHHLLTDFSVLENVAMPALIGNFSVKHAKNLAYKLLLEVGLKNRINHKPSEISGGERQRAAIARSLINNPKIVFADEPTGNLDNTSSKKFFCLLKKVNVEKKTAFLVVTHNIKLAKKLDKTLEIKNGKLYKKNL